MVDVMQNEEILKKNYCHDCGKQFVDTRSFQRHKDRKTPCIIREVPNGQMDNPNRCIHCNKIFSNKSHLVRHLKSCKIKNGGMNILVDKVHYEHEIKLLKANDKAKDNDISNLKKQMQEISKQLEQLKQNSQISSYNNWLYFICSEQFDGKVKIGRSINPQKRLKQLQTGNPNKLMIYKLVGFDDEINMESITHKYFKDVNIINEWFEISKECIDIVCNELNEPLLNNYQ